MALTNTLEGIRSRIQTSIFGRRLGLDSNDFLVGAKDNIKPIETISSTAASQTLAAHGVSVITATNASTDAALAMTLAAPIPGVEKFISQMSSSTAGYAITLASGQFISSGSSAGVTLTSLGANQSMSLLGLSTAAYLMTRGVSATFTVT